MASANKAFSPGNLRYYRLSSILQIEGKSVLISYLETFFIGTTFSQYLKGAHIKAKLDNLLRRKVFIQKQYDRLYPQTGQAEIQTLDISLLFILIRSLHKTIPANDNVWIDPNPGDQSAEADITRLSKTRNWLIGHPKEIELTENEFIYEAQILTMTITRLAKTIGMPSPRLQDISDSINYKLTSRFDHAPGCREVATSTTDSLGKEFRLSKEIQASCSTLSVFSDQERNSLEANSSSIESLWESELSKTQTESLYMMPSRTDSCFHHSSSINEDKPVVECLPYAVEHCMTKHVSTSTSSLQNKRKLSFKVKSFIEPFIIKPKMQNVERSETLPCIARKDRRRRRKCSSSQCVMFECIGSSERISHISEFYTMNHTALQYRCSLKGMTCLRNGHIIVTDTAHDCIQVFDKKFDFIAEIECSRPRGICAISDDAVLVSLSEESKLVIYQCHFSLQYVREINVSCEGWLFDVKFSEGTVYVACDRNEIHIISLIKMSCSSTKEAVIRLRTDRRVEFFDISPNGDNIIISDGSGVICLDMHGTELWNYRGNGTRFSTTGVVALRDRILIALWEEGVLLELTYEGKKLSQTGIELVQRPYALAHCAGRLLVSQYMSTLDEDVCREVAVLRAT